MSRIVHTSKSLALMVGLVMFGGVAVAPAIAATITYNFSGEVDQVGRRVNGTSNFNTSSTMTGTMTVNTQDLLNPPPAANANRGIYNIESFSVTVGNYTASFGLSPSNQVEIRNQNGGDRFLVSVDDLTGNPVRAIGPAFFEIDLRGPKSVFSNDHLPTSLPSISAFDDVTEWRLVFGTGGSTRTVSGEVSSITAVPLPAGVVLFGVGLVALIGLGAGGLRNLRLPQA
jgi:hypothetical protein